MKDYKNIVIGILVILLVASTCIAVHYVSLYLDRENTIETKNIRIQDLETELYNCKMARDETYELFLNCVYPNGVPDYKPTYE